MSWYARVLSQAASSRRSLAVATIAGGSWFLDSSSDLSFFLKTDNTTFCDASSSHNTKSKTFTAEEVSRHNGHTHPETWVSYQGKVYDITKFLKQHPGGDVIHDAAGGPLENYWAYWAYHMALDGPMNFLKQYEIGLLAEEEEEIEDLETIAQEMYATDPDRKQAVANGQIALLDRPWCSETDPRLLATPFTPNKAFYVRNHAPVPVLNDGNEDDYEVTIEYDLSISDNTTTTTITTKTLTLASLKERFPMVTVNSILQCAGNRGADMIQVAPTAFSGTPYENIGTGMIGHASWKGVYLADVLLDAFPVLKQLSQKELNSMHVEFEGVDGYKVSTPLYRVLDKSYDALLAMEMNHEKLPPNHGGPLRVLLPGIAGARNCKWVFSIKIVPEESKSCFQKTYYLDYHGRAIQEMPMQCFMVSKIATNTNTCKVKGVAWGGGSGIGIQRVQVSADNGETWINAKLYPVPHQEQSCSNHREWSWVHFEAEFPLKDPKAPLPTVVSRAIDRSGLQQPEKLWYPKGYLSNGWHKM